jgi:hypothetical protein
MLGVNYHVGRRGGTKVDRFLSPMVQLKIANVPNAFDGTITLWECQRKAP